MINMLVGRYLKVKWDFIFLTLTAGPLRGPLHRRPVSRLPIMLSPDVTVVTYFLNIDSDWERLVTVQS